jgi:hypothetical protein
VLTAEHGVMARRRGAARAATECELRPRPGGAVRRVSLAADFSAGIGAADRDGHGVAVALGGRSPLRWPGGAGR